MDEWTATAIGNLAPWMFEPSWGPWKDFRKIGNCDQQNGNKDFVELCVESLGGLEDAGKLKETVLASFKACLPDAWRSHQTNFFKLM